MEDSIVYCSTTTISHYKIFIEGELDDPAACRDAIVALGSAAEHDKVSIFINSPGGSVDIGLSIRNAVLSCQASTEAIITGTVASAATYIALACDSLYMYEHTTFMLHDVAVASDFLSMNNTKIRTDYQRKWSEDLLLDIYGNFLDDNELIALAEGKDFWFSPEEVMKRLQRNVESKLAGS